jgi:hypothetical protein
MTESLFVIDLGLNRSVRLSYDFSGTASLNADDFLGAVAPDLARLLQLKDLIEDRHHQWDTQSEFFSASDRAAHSMSYSWRDSSNDMMYTRHRWFEEILRCVPQQYHMRQFISWDNTRVNYYKSMFIQECIHAIQHIENLVASTIADILLVEPDTEKKLGITLRNVYDTDIREHVLKVISIVNTNERNWSNGQQLSSTEKKFSVIKPVKRYQDRTSDWPNDPKDLIEGVNDTIAKFRLANPQISHTIKSSDKFYLDARYRLRTAYQSTMNKMRECSP